MDYIYKSPSSPTPSKQIIKIIILNRDYSSFYIIDSRRGEVADERVSKTYERITDHEIIQKINPIQNKLFSNDLFYFNDEFEGEVESTKETQLRRETLKSKTKELNTNSSVFNSTSPSNNITIIESPIKIKKDIPGILILENNKTYGRTNNKKRLFYKCIPNDKQLPAFIIPYEIQVGFNKVFKNKYVTFKYDCWTGQHPQGLLLQTLGNIDELPIFYEYQLYCRELHHSMIHFINKAKNYTELNDPDICKKIFDKENSKGHYIQDRRTTHNVFSIDPLGATDFDDAFSIQEVNLTATESKTPPFYQISIYIANVYIWMDNFNMWDHFSDRVATIYLPDKRRPLLPTIFSENLCSLKKGEDRFAFTMTVIIDSNGNIIEDETLSSATPEFSASSTSAPPPRLQTLSSAPPPRLQTKYSNTLISVKNNFTYEENKLLLDKDYNLLFSLINKKNKIDNSMDLVSFLMIYMNSNCAKILYNNKKGIFRSSSSILPTIKNLPLWNNYSGNYVLYNNFVGDTIGEVESKTKELKHESLGLDQYVHVTSPIRRIVDIINQTLLFQQIGICIISPEAERFIEKYFLKIDQINKHMKSIRKIQCDCELVNKCFSNSFICDSTSSPRLYKGIICEKIEKLENGLFQYMIYLEELQLMARMKCNDNLENASYHSFKIFLFEDEDKIQKKIRVQLFKQ